MNKVALLYFCFFLCVLSACVPGEKGKKTDEAEKNNAIIIGFSQIGAESAWRTCNTESVLQAAAAEGIQVIYHNAEQKQENQIKALRSFIAYQVDVIVFVPIVAHGWENVLREAGDAGIPVLVIDRKIITNDENSYAGFIGTDSVQEGRNAALFLLQKFADHKGLISIVEMSGTEKSSPAVGRAKGFREIIKTDSRFKIICSESGDFLRSKGKELMAQILDNYNDIDVIFSHNDGMTLGILDTLEERGIKAGTELVIVSIDAEQAAIDALKEGKINCVVECNPKIGAQVMRLVKQLAAGNTIPKIIHVEETVFDEYMDVRTTPPRGY